MPQNRWTADEREKQRLRCRAWHALNRESRNAARKQWNKDNPHRRLEQKRTERLKKQRARSMTALNAGLS